MKKNNNSKKTYKEIMEEIKPYLKPKKIVQYSTAGKWNIYPYGIEENENI